MELTPANNWFLFNLSTICFVSAEIQRMLHSKFLASCMEVRLYSSNSTHFHLIASMTWTAATKAKVLHSRFQVGTENGWWQKRFFWWFSSKVQDWAKHFAKGLCGWNQHELVFTAFHSSPLACWQEAKNSENTAKLHLVVPERKHVAHFWTIDCVACWHILSTARWCNPRCICRPYWTLYDCRAITAASQGQGWQHKVGSQRIHSLDFDCF